MSGNSRSPSRTPPSNGRRRLTGESRQDRSRWYSRQDRRQNSLNRTGQTQANDQHCRSSNRSRSPVRRRPTPVPYLPKQVARRSARQPGYQSDSDQSEPQRLVRVPSEPQKPSNTSRNERSSSKDERNSEPPNRHSQTLRTDATNWPPEHKNGPRTPTSGERLQRH